MRGQDVMVRSELLAIVKTENKEIKKKKKKKKTGSRAGLVMWICDLYIFKQLVWKQERMKSGKENE